MKILQILAILVFFAVNGYANISAFSEKENGWSQNGKLVPDTDNMKSKDGFGAQLWVINDDSFIEKWNKPEPPTVPVARTAKRNKPVFIIFFFINAGMDEKSQTDVFADVTITGPDGKVIGVFKDIELWQGRNETPENNIQLGVNQLDLTIEDTDLLGPYTIEAVVKDRVQNIQLNLKTVLIAEE